MRNISRGQVWEQKKGSVTLRIDYFCKAHQCPVKDELIRSAGKDHVHVMAWNRYTFTKTNHSIIEVDNLYSRWRCLDDPQD